MQLRTILHLDPLRLLQIQLTGLFIRSVFLGLVQVRLSLSLGLTAPFVQAVEHLLLDTVVRPVLAIHVVLEVVDCVLVDVVDLVQVRGHQLVAVGV